MPNATGTTHSPGERARGRKERTPLSGFLVSVLVFCLLLPPLSGCGLIFGDGRDAPRPRKSLASEEESTATPLPYDVEFVVIFDDGSSETSTSVAEERARREAEGKDREEQEKEPAADQGNGQTEGDLADLAGVESGTANGDGKDTGSSAADASRAPDKDDDLNLVEGMEKVSQLVSLKETPPDGALGLELRAQKDVETAIKFLASQGYYDGRVTMEMTGQDTEKARVVITLHTGRRYVVGDISILYEPEPRILPEVAKYKRILFGNWIPRVRKGRPVVAERILEGVRNIPTRMHNHGYPDARVVEEFYYLDRAKRTLNILVEVNPGAPAYMAMPDFTGKSDVNHAYLKRIVHWDPGTPWDARRLDRYLSHLRRTGLFHTVNLKEGTALDAYPDGYKPVEIEVEDARHRSVGGMVRYDTDTGFGAELHWEHRNVFGNGEKFSATAPYTSTDRGVEFEFLKPAFLARGQILRANAEAMDETTDAYDRRGVMGRAGIMKFWNRQWMTVGGLFADTGQLKNNERDLSPYTIYGLDLRVRRDTRNNRQNPTSGLDAELKLSPMAGRYSGDFTAVGGELAVSGFWAPFKWRSGRPKDKLVFAGRVGLGAITGSELDNIPSTYRFYMGGMDTVRGYGYQQIGPMDADGDPVGGRSYQMVNLESRFKITDSLGLVAFLDGGQLYTSEFPEFDTDMDWGAGMGVRYFTPVGPVRLDVAFPLKEVDPPVQFYISIGQSF